MRKISRVGRETSNWSQRLDAKTLSRGKAILVPTVAAVTIANVFIKKSYSVLNKDRL